MCALAYKARPILIDFVEQRLLEAEKLGVRYTVNPQRENMVEKVKKITKGNMAELVMECSGAESAVQSTLDLVSNAGRITLTGWPKNVIELQTTAITRKEVDILGARTSANEFEEAIQLIAGKQVDVKEVLTKVVSVNEVPDTIKDIEQNPGNYMKVNVMF